MNHYRICVYAISKNEERFVKTWAESMAEADKMIVLDTGSTDGTVEQLRACGAEVHTAHIDPWRFDTARNRSLALVPEDYDICVCTDLDERFHPGWREKLEAAWADDVSLANYRYTWNFAPDGSEGVVFWIEKAHARHGFEWVHPVHEVLRWTGSGAQGRTASVPGMQLDHHADLSKSRAQYLPLLELSVREEPMDDRNLHYLGREYMYHERWDDCIRTLKQHLALPTATWRDERAASMRFIARACLAKGQREEARGWYLRAIAEAPHLREGWLDLARLLYDGGEWEGVLYFTGCALAIRERPHSYICEAASWGSLPHDLRAIAYFRTGRCSEALKEARQALTLAPGEERLRKNVEVLEQLAQG